MEKHCETCNCKTDAERIAELEREVEELKNRPTYVPYPYPVYQPIRYGPPTCWRCGVTGYNHLCSWGIAWGNTGGGVSNGISIGSLTTLFGSESPLIAEAAS